MGAADHSGHEIDGARLTLQVPGALHSIGTAVRLLKMEYGGPMSFEVTPPRHALTRRSLLVAAGGALACAGPGIAWAQTYPTRPVRLVIPLGPGGVGDITARIVAEKLSDKMGRQFFIENMPSPDGLTAMRTVAGAAPDGYTLLLFTGGIASSIAVYNRFPIDVFKSFTPVSTIGYFDCLMVANASSNSTTWVMFLLQRRATSPARSTSAPSAPAASSI